MFFLRILKNKIVNEQQAELLRRSIDKLCSMPLKISNGTQGSKKFRRYWEATEEAR